MTTSMGQGLCKVLTTSVTAEIVLGYLSLTDILVLRCVCHQLRSDMDDARLNINIFLSDFVDDCESFRRELGKSDALLTGGLVLNFLETCHRRKVDHLDVLMQEQHANTFMTYLQLHEKYTRLDTRIPHAWVAWGEAPHKQNPFILQRPLSGLRIRVKTTTTFPIHALLQSSYTTAQLNFMSWNKMYSLFPFETFSNHKFYPLRRLDNDFGALLHELAGQGWTTRDLVWLDTEPDATPHGVGSRRIGDALSAVLPIVPTISVSKVTPDYVIEHAEFEVMDRVMEPSPRRKSKYRCKSRELSILVEVEELNSPSLRYRYTTSLGGSGASWREFAEEQLRRWTLIELYKMPQDRRAWMSTIWTPPQQFTLEMPGDFQLPKNWDYADDQIPQWYGRYMKKRKMELPAEKDDGGLFSRV